MSDKVFLDTHVLVYAYDQSQPDKQARAQALLSWGIEREKAVLNAGQTYCGVRVENPFLSC